MLNLLQTIKNDLTENDTGLRMENRRHIMPGAVTKSRLSITANNTKKNHWRNTSSH